MARFYIQSGTLRMVVHADEADRAALWAVHQVLAQVLPVFDDEELTAHQKQAAAALRGMIALDEQIRLSEQGFDRDDALAFDTAAVVTEWSQLVIALQRIEQRSVRETNSGGLCLAM